MHPRLFISLITLALVPHSVCAQFIQERCTVEARGTVSLRLVAPDRSIRSLAFDPQTKSISFKGTTLADLKWVKGYSSFKEISLVKSTPEAKAGELLFTAGDGATKTIGAIQYECWHQLERAVNNAVPTHIKPEG
ncbi:hypothetical protein AACH06_29710 [Ideonella sp. DXS29W]|uniref:C-type lysozyme inhibitor domain-containing protein n=1 Tax=Ideonella lacteola TaxID=2984193 RepID=A0ABU9BZY8_9BURK